MGLLGDGFWLLAGSAKDAIDEQARINELKKGKSAEQCRVIDFFYGAGESGGCCGFFSKVGSHTMTMEEYLKLVTEKCNTINTKQMAINKIGLDVSEIQEIAPINLSSFVFDNDTAVKVNGQLAVSNQFAITWIFFSATQIYTYKYIFDTMSDNVWEFTNDFFYSDITCLSTLREVKEKIDQETTGCFNKKASYIKHNYVVDTFEIRVPNSSYCFSMRYNPAFDQSVKAAKAMLREKKFNK